MFLKSTRFLAAIAIAALVFSGCSSKETTDAYNKYYGSGGEERAREAFVKDSVERANQKATQGEKVAPVAKESAGTLPPPSAEVAALLEKNTCAICHKPNEKVVGPAFAEIAKKGYTADEIVELVHNPKPEHWPDYPPMAPLAHVSKEDIVKIANWINSK